MKPIRWWLLPLLLVSAAVTMGASGEGCGDTGGGGGGNGGGGGIASSGGNGDGGGNQKPPEPASDEPEMTFGQQQAVQVAQDYIDLQGFSKAGLIQQLSSSAGEGFPKADAEFAANNVDVDWNAEAVEAAEDYLELGGMSESSLLDQLSSSAGEGFTPEEAQYAVDKVYGP